MLGGNDFASNLWLCLLKKFAVQNEKFWFGSLGGGNTKNGMEKRERK